VLTLDSSILSGNSAPKAGGVANLGMMTVNNSTISGNVATTLGGGITNPGTMTVNDSTISGNSAADGGGLSNLGTLTISNSTLSSNSASASGGGIYLATASPPGMVTLVNCTLSGNTAVTGGGIDSAGTVTLTNSTISANSAGQGGGIFNTGTLTLANTIVGGNTASSAPDLETSGGTVGASYTMIGNTAGSGISGGTGNVLNPTYLGLSPLGDYGGPTQTVALLTGSPAIDAGSNGLAVDAQGNALTTDQRGKARIGNGTVDIGAFESQAPTQLVVSTPYTATAGTSFNLTVTAEDGGGDMATTFSGTVTLSSSLGGDISTTSVALTNGTATIPLTLTAAGTQTITAAFTGLTSGTASIAITPGTFSQYLVAVQDSSTVQAGGGFLIAVQAADAFGNPITSYSGPATVTASTSPTSAASNFPATVSINSNGLGLFLGTLQKVGSYTITAANSSYSGSTITPVTVTPGPAVKLSFAAQPVNTPTGVTLPSVTVQILDQYGNVVTSDHTGSVTLAVASGPGSFMAGSTTTAPVHNGAATFGNLTLVKPGTYQLSTMIPNLYTGPYSAVFHVVPLQVLAGSFVGTPSGFSLQFSAPYLVNSVTPVLYGQGFGATARTCPFWPSTF